MKILKFIFFIPYWMVLTLLTIVAVITNVVYAIWVRLGVSMGFTSLRYEPDEGLNKAMKKFINLTEEEESK